MSEVFPEGHMVEKEVHREADDTMAVE